MRDITVDARRVRTRRTLLARLAAALELPEGDAKNLDALYDLLSCEDRPAHVTLLPPRAPKGELAETLPKLLAMLEDAQRENPRLTFEVK